MKKSTKYVTTVKLIPGATTEGMIYHVKGCMVDFAPDIVLLHCGTNDLKKNLHLRKSHRTYVVRCAIWYHLCNLKNVKTPIEEC